MGDWADIADKISTTLTILKQAGSLVKDITPLVQDSGTKEKLNDVREQLLTASERVNELRAINNEIVDRNLVLESEIREIQTFLSKRDSYVPYKLGRGAFVYVAEKDAENAEHAPWYCQHCFEVEHRLSPLNYTRRGDGRLAVYECRSCGFATEDYPRN